VADGWRKYPGGLSRAYGAVVMGCKAAGDATLATRYLSQMLQDEETTANNSATTANSATTTTTTTADHMGWQTSGVDERAVKTVLRLLRPLLSPEQYRALLKTHEPTLTRIGTLATEHGTTTEAQNVRYSRLIKRACDRGEYERGRALFEQMALDGIPRNVISWTTMVRAVVVVRVFLLLLLLRINSGSTADRRQLYHGHCGRRYLYKKVCSLDLTLPTLSGTT